MTQPTAGASPKGRPGQMTAVMRALPQATGPKVLRIGLVQGGRVIEERVIKQRTNVTVGPSEKNMFVVAAQGVPTTFRLFELVGSDYHLCFLDGMSGRLALQTGISDLEALKGQAKHNAQGAYQVRLTEEARGKIVIGETTFLFQFVAPPPVQPKPQLPVSVQSGVSSQIDWRFTIIASFSFLFHFGAVGMLYSDWMDAVINEEVSVAGLLDTMRSLPPPPPPPPESDQGKPGDASAESSGGQKTSGPKGPQGPAGPAGPKAGMSDTQRAALSNELDKLELATVGALGGQGAATSGVLRGGDMPTGALELAAASGSGTGTSGGTGLNLGSGGGGTIRPGAAGGGLGAVTGSTSGEAAKRGEEQKVAGPKGNASVGGAAVSGGGVKNAQSVVAGMRAGFRACYNQGLSANPDMSGAVRVTAQIGPNGEVRSANATPSGTVSGAVASCIAARVKSATFDPPEGGAATIVIPVTLVQQK